jgi:hypothetical protein
LAAWLARHQDAPLRGGSHAGRGALSPKLRIARSKSAMARRSKADAQCNRDSIRIIRRLGDGHVRLRWPQTSNPPASRVADCTALGYATDWQEAAVTPLIPGYVPLKSEAESEFPSGTIQQGHHRIGSMRIGTFSPKGFPELCHEALRSLSIDPGAAPVRWTVYRLRFLISSPSILHPKRSLPPQAAEALGGFFLQCAENRPRIKLQALRSRPTPGVGISANPTLRRFCIRDHAASLAA